MQCRSCGTEIADKAIVCYRCGAATTDPVRKPVEIRPRRSPMPSFVAAAILVLAALYAGYVSSESPDPSRWRAIAGILAGAAGIIIILGIVRRR
jgi:hypothetical protein